MTALVIQFRAQKIGIGGGVTKRREDQRLQDELDADRLREELGRES
jgi:hypothetical protein